MDTTMQSLLEYEAHTHAHGRTNQAKPTSSILKNHLIADIMIQKHVYRGMLALSGKQKQTLAT